MDRFTPRYALAPHVQADLLAIESAERELQAHEADPLVARRILREALARNTFGTVSIEGNPLTLDQVESLLEAAPSEPMALAPAERDVVNIAAFLADLAAHRLPRTPADLEGLHATLFAGTVDAPGRFKTRPNFIGRHRDRTVVYVPTAPERVAHELAEALEWFHASTEHPVVRVAVFFHELQSIHPFLDGNGRLGRAVAALQLHHLGYPSVSFATVDYAINQDRAQYYDALAVSQGGAWDLSPWVAYWGRVLRGAYDDAVQRFLFRGAVPDDLDSRALEVAMWVARRDRARPGRRVAVADVHAAFPMLARRTLQRDLAKLVAREVLESAGAGRGARYRLHSRFRVSE